MDNASKALIMAGAILIAIALISLGVYLYTSAADLSGNAIKNIDVLNMSVQNGQLQKFEGTKVKGSEVRQLIDYVAAINIQEAMPDEISINITDKSSIRAAKYYTVVCEDKITMDGYIDTITITDYTGK